MAKVIDIDPSKRFTREHWKLFKQWVDQIDPDKVGSVYVAFFNEDGSDYESFTWGLDWRMLGYLRAELDRFNSTMYAEEMGEAEAE